MHSTSRFLDRKHQNPKCKPWGSVTTSNAGKFLQVNSSGKKWNSCIFFKEKPLKKLTLYFLVHHAPVAQQGPQTKELLNIYLLNLATAQFQDSNTQHSSNEFPGLRKLRNYLSLKRTQGYKGTEILPFCRKRSAITCTTLSCSPGCLVRGGSTTGQIKVKAQKVDAKLIWLSRNAPMCGHSSSKKINHINTSIKLKLSSFWSSSDFLLGSFSEKTLALTARWVF